MHQVQVSSEWLLSLLRVRQISEEVQYKQTLCRSLNSFLSGYGFIVFPPWICILSSVLYSGFSIKALWFPKTWNKWQTAVLTVHVEFSFWLRVNPRKTSRYLCIPVTKQLVFPLIRHTVVLCAEAVPYSTAGKLPKLQLVIKVTPCFKTVHLPGLFKNSGYEKDI